MKEIKAIFRPSRLWAVIQELQGIEGLPGLTVSDIRGIGKGLNQRSRGGSEIFELSPRVKLEVVVNEELVDKVVDAIQRQSHTGNTGDGKIFVSSVDQTVKIRTNERGPQAI